MLKFLRDLFSSCDVDQEELFLAITRKPQYRSAHDLELLAESKRQQVKRMRDLIRGK